MEFGPQCQKMDYAEADNDAIFADFFRGCDIDFDFWTNHSNSQFADSYNSRDATYDAPYYGGSVQDPQDPARYQIPVNDTVVGATQNNVLQLNPNPGTMEWENYGLQDHAGYVNPVHTQRSLGNHANTSGVDFETWRDNELQSHEQRRHFTPDQVLPLQAWLDAHLDQPYPSLEIKAKLAAANGLHIKQIEAWFSRTRQKKARAVQDGDEQVRYRESICSNSSLDVLHSSLPGDELAEHQLDKRWSDSHLARLPVNDPVISLETWPSTHFDWWLHHIPEATTTDLQQLQDMTDHHLQILNGNDTGTPVYDDLGLSRADNASSASSWQVSARHQERDLCIFGDGARSTGSSISGFSRFSANSRSSRPNYIGCKSTRGHRRASSRMSSTSHNSGSHQRSSGLVSSSLPDVSSVYKRRKNADSTTSFVSIGSHYSNFSHNSHKRRQGKRLSDIFSGPPSLKMSRPEKNYWCTFCDSTFKDAYRWQRHEESVHCPAKVWTCCPTPLGDMTFRAKWPHPYSIAARSCWSKPAIERTFFRKDAMVQHLSIVHRCEYGPNELDNAAELMGIVSPSEPSQLLCPFCHEMCASWQDRVQHLRKHFSQKTAIWPFDRVSVSRNWENPFGICTTTLSDVDSFVAGSIVRDKTSDWKCPLCAYTVSDQDTLPYLHTCSQHWNELPNFLSQPTFSQKQSKAPETQVTSHQARFFGFSDQQGTDSKDIRTGCKSDRVNGTTLFHLLGSNATTCISTSENQPVSLAAVLTGARSLSPLPFLSSRLSTGSVSENVLQPYPMVQKAAMGQNSERSPKRKFEFQRQEGAREESAAVIPNPPRTSQPYPICDGCRCSKLECDESFYGMCIRSDRNEAEIATAASRMASIEPGLNVSALMEPISNSSAVSGISNQRQPKQRRFSFRAFLKGDRR